jgi:phosphoglycerate dehydrogenase-like enzyme
MTHSVLIVSNDAEELAAIVGDIGATVAIARDEHEALDTYSDQSILFGSPLAISRVLADMPSVRWVQSTWAGNTPLLGLERRDYTLTGIKDVFGPQMAEYVIGHLLAIELKLARRADAQRGRQWLDEPSGTLISKNIGIMGTGSIARTIAQRAATFGLMVTGLSRNGQAVPEFVGVFCVDRIGDFLPGLDYLVGVLPETAATNNLLDDSALSLLPPHAVFVNVGRGNVVDDDALIGALNSGRLGGAVLDVFDEEPVPGDSSLWEAKNLVITAHIAAISHPDLIVPIFLENYERFVAGQTLLHAIDFEQGY